MNITKTQYNNVQLPYEQQSYEFSQITAILNDDANGSLQDWSGHGNYFISFTNSTGDELYNREEVVDKEWAKIAHLSRERWLKENPY